MSERPEWTYYRYGWLDSPSVGFYRRWRGMTQGLRRGEPLSWVPADDDRLSRYLENGETALDETTRADIEAEIGQPLPV